jgi:hypothetical protein
MNASHHPLILHDDDDVFPKSTEIVAIDPHTVLLTDRNIAHRNERNEGNANGVHLLGLACPFNQGAEGTATTDTIA